MIDDVCQFVQSLQLVIQNLAGYTCCLVYSGFCVALTRPPVKSRDFDRFCQEWWDDCDKAGAKTRPAAAFEDAVPSLKALSIDNNSLKKHARIQF